MPYLTVSIPNHPHAHTNGYVRAHRAVVEQYLYRYLEPTEYVHHINGNVQDNRIENLVAYASHAAHMSMEHRSRPMRYVPEGFSKNVNRPERDIVLYGPHFGKKARDKRLKQLAQQSIRELQFRRSLAA